MWMQLILIQTCEIISRSSINRAADERANHILMQKIHYEFTHVFSEIGCFEGTFRLQVKEGSWPYQQPPRRVAYALQEFQELQGEA